MNKITDIELHAINRFLKMRHLLIKWKLSTNYFLRHIKTSGCHTLSYTHHLP